MEADILILERLVIPKPMTEMIEEDTHFPINIDL